jgi:hypothetical protein
MTTYNIRSKRHDKHTLKQPGHDKKRKGCHDMSKKIECRLPDDLYADLKEYACKEGVTVTDIVIAGINNQIHGLTETAKKQECQPMPEPEIMPVSVHREVKKQASKSIIAKEPYKEPEPCKALPNGYIPKSAQELRAMYKSSFPLQVCIKCQRFNRECIC